MAGIRSYNHKIADTVIEGSVGYIIDLQSMGGMDIQVNAIVNSTANVVASSSITFATCNFHYSAHGYYTGLKGRFTTSSALPAGLSLATDYYIIVVDEDNFKIASSLANALATPPVPVTLTNAGTGNQTFTPVTISSCSYKLQKSNDWDPIRSSGSFIDLVSGETNSVVSNSISSTSNTAASAKQIYAAYGKITFLIAAGSVAIKIYASAKAL